MDNTTALNHIRQQALLIEKMAGIIEKLPKDWNVWRVDNGSGFWIKTPNKKNFAIHYKYSRLTSEMKQGIELNAYTFAKQYDYPLDDDMDTAIVEHMKDLDKLM